MAIMGTRLREVRMAVQPLGQPPERIAPVVKELVASAKLTGDRGFFGDEEKKYAGSLAERAASISPTLSRDEAMLAADLATKSLDRSKIRVELAMKVVVTVFCLVAGIIVLLSQESDTLQKWASGVIGTAVGYWLA